LTALDESAAGTKYKLQGQLGAEAERNSHCAGTMDYGGLRYCVPEELTMVY